MGILVRSTLSIGAAALFAGCGGSQPPIGAPGAMAQSRAVATRANSASYKVLYKFGALPDGRNPAAGLIDVGGTLYGATAAGGSHLHPCDHPSGPRGCGTVFNITTYGAEKVLYSFGARSDGIHPNASLIDASGTLYGTTTNGGPYTCGFSSHYVSCGTVFSITPSGTEKVLHSFQGYPNDGDTPVAALIEVKGTLYGTTVGGGTSSNCLGGCGTVFSITPSGTYKVLHSFHGNHDDGDSPNASLIEVGGALYGTTSGSGAYSWGTVFKITLSGNENVLHSFGNGTDAAYPLAALVDVRGTLYGTTALGGANSCDVFGQCGTVFSITPSGTEKVLHRFSGGTDGGSPRASLINLKDTLYGTTELGGSGCSGDGCGTVFSITPTGAEKVLHSFGAKGDGSSPEAGLIDVGGTLYGTTWGGGKNLNGTIFALKP